MRSQPQRLNAQSAAPLSKVNEELTSVTKIMTTNIQELLGRGERLDRTQKGAVRAGPRQASACQCPVPATRDARGRSRTRTPTGMTEMSGHLSAESRKYMNSAKKINLQLLYRKYGPAVVVGLVIVVVLYIRLYWF